MRARNISSIAAILSAIPVCLAQGAEGASPVFTCVIETEFDALSPDLPEGGFRAPQWDVEFEFDTGSGMLRYRNLDLGGFDPPRRWDVVQQGGDGVDWIAVYRPELGPEQNTRVLDASVVLRIRTWASDRVPGSEREQNRFYLLQYDVFGVGRCAPG